MATKDVTPEAALDKRLRAELGNNPNSESRQSPYVVTNISQINREGPLEVHIWYRLTPEQTALMNAIIRESGVDCVIRDDTAGIERRRGQNPAHHPV